MILIIGYAGLRNLDPKLSTIWYPITNEQIGREDLFERGARGYPLYGDYAPTAMQGELNKPHAPGMPMSPPLTARQTIKIQSEGGAVLLCMSRRQPHSSCVCRVSISPTGVSS